VTAARLPESCSSPIGILAELHDELHDKVARYRYLADAGEALGDGGTMLFGGSVSFAALGEARSSFVHGNFIATILLCQSFAENTLAGFLHIRSADLPNKVSFQETLGRAESSGILNSDDVAALKKLAELRNPLSHFRSVSDPGNLTRRSMTTDELPEEILRVDAHFAISTIIRLLANAPFNVRRSL
jgi:hypothetical protein